MLSTIFRALQSNEMEFSMKPRVTVIMPFRNSEKFLDESIISILNQTFSEFEFIIINDASTDASDEFVKRYLGDRRIRYIKNRESIGITKNLNNALAAVTTEFVVRMDGDDVSEPNRIKEQVDFMDKNPDVSVLGTWATLINEEGLIITEQRKLVDTKLIQKNIFIYNPVFHPSVIFRTRDVLAVGGYNESYLNGQDMDLWIRMICEGYQITNLPNNLIRYRYHNDSTAHKARLNAIRDLKIRFGNMRRYIESVSPMILIQVFIYFVFSYFVSGRFRQKIERFYSQKFFINK